MSVSDVARELGVRWKQVPFELKNKYEQAASEKKNAYQAEMAIYRHQTSTSSSPPLDAAHEYPPGSHLNQVFEPTFHAFDVNDIHGDFEMIDHGASLNDLDGGAGDDGDDDDDDDNED